MPTVSKCVDVEVDIELDDFSDADLIEECERRSLPAVVVKPPQDATAYVDAALRDALADPNTPRSFRDLLYFVHGRTIA